MRGPVPKQGAPKNPYEQSALSLQPFYKLSSRNPVVH